MSFFPFAQKTYHHSVNTVHLILNINQLRHPGFQSLCSVSSSFPFMDLNFGRAEIRGGALVRIKTEISIRRKRERMQEGDGKWSTEATKA